jgi:hypothetical protein
MTIYMYPNSWIDVFKIAAKAVAPAGGLVVLVICIKKQEIVTDNPQPIANHCGSWLVKFINFDTDIPTNADIT